MGVCKERHIFIDSLRVFSIFYIVAIWHLDDYVGDCFYSPITEILTYGVLNVFVMISSSMIVNKYSSIDSFSEVKEFIFSRVFRIYPIYLIGIICFAWKGDIPVKTICSHLLLVNMLIGDSMGTLWFIGMIFNYYFLIVIILWKFSWSRFTTVVVIAIFSLLILNTLKIIDVRLLYYLPAFFLGFLFGKDRFNTIIDYSRFIVIIAFFLFLFVVIIAYYFGLQMGSKVFYVGGFFFIIPLIALFRVINWNPVEKIVIFLSYSSFCMYVFHRIVFSLLLDLFNPESPWYRLFYLVFFAVPLIILISFFIQKSYDAIFGNLYWRKFATRFRLI